jgi:hypothetical protein
MLLFRHKIHNIFALKTVKDLNSLKAILEPFIDKK